MRGADSTVERSAATTQADVSFEHYPDVARNRERIAAALEAHTLPMFFGDRALLLARLARLRAALAQHWGEHVVGFSFKTNYQVAETGLLRDAGVRAEVVSGREYRMARRLGYAGDSIIFNGPYKAEPELRDALSDGALVHINDGEELRRVVQLQSELGTPRSVGLRVSAMVEGQPASRFGFPIESGEAARAIATASAEPLLRLDGLHLHLRGDTDDPSRYAEAGHKLGELAATQIYRHGRALNYVDIGGGFPAHGPRPRSRATWNPLEIEAYIEAAATALRPHFPSPRLPKLIVEPGRYLTGDAVMFVTRVIRAAASGDQQDLTCDATITMLPLTHYARNIVRVFSPDLTHRGGGPGATRVYGSSCREDDLMYDGALSPARVGDLLVFYAVGAYNANLSPGFIFEAPRLVLFDSSPN